MTDDGCIGPSLTEGEPCGACIFVKGLRLCKSHYYQQYNEKPLTPLDGRGRWTRVEEARPYDATDVQEFLAQHYRGFRLLRGREYNGVRS